MSVKENKELILQSIKEFNETSGSTAKVRAWLDKWNAPNIISHETTGDQNKEQHTQTWISLVSAFPDMKMTIDDMVAEGDKVAATYTMRGIHKGAYGGMTATGKQIIVKGVVIHKLAGGKYSEMWNFPDMLGLMTQLGAIPAPKK